MHDRHGTVLPPRGPLAQGNPDLHADPVLRRIAAAHGRTVLTYAQPAPSA
ncbi:hypothetical protein ACFV4P_12440 [Kitasatospora sp. NPDC059795]